MVGVHGATDRDLDRVPAAPIGPGHSGVLGGDVGASELVSRLSEIESQTLGERADAYGLIYDELRRRLELGNEPASDASPQD